MSVSTFVRADRLRLAWLFRSTEETRYYLNGVFIHTSGSGVCLAATDGHRLAVFRDEAGFTRDNCIVAMPKPALDAIKGTKPELREYLWFGIVGDHFGTGRRRARVFDTNKGYCTPSDAQELMEDETHDGVIWSGAVTLIDGTFPEYSMSIPATRGKQAESAAFNPKLLAPFIEVATEKDVTGIRLYAAGEQDSMLVDCGRRDFVGVLMPLRIANEVVTDDGYSVHPPEWAMRRREDLLARLRPTAEPAEA